MFRFFRSSPKPAPVDDKALPASASSTQVESSTASEQPTFAEAPRQSWLSKLKAGLRKTGGSIASVFTGTQIDDNLYEELETALLLADTGVKATQYLLTEVKRLVKETKTTEPAAVKALLIQAITELLLPLEQSLTISDNSPTVIMVTGVNGAGKTTSIGKLTQYLAQSGQTVLLAAADTYRAAAREQLGVWADRSSVEIISQAGADPGAHHGQDPRPACRRAPEPAGGA